MPVKGNFKLQHILVLDKLKTPLMPCHPARARKLLKKGKAKVFRTCPFTIILTERIGGNTQEVELKIDGGSKTTGIALVVKGKEGDKTKLAIHLEHRGHTIKKALDSRRAIRRSRRNRKTRYRKPRFLNRIRPTGWLAPSLKSRVDNIITWSKRLISWCPVSIIHNETVRFDMQLMENPEISGVEYQQGTLKGYEVREYLLEKFNRKCIYCKVEGVPLEIEHIIPKARGGTNRISNLTLACTKCNQDKGTQTAAEYGHPKVQAQAKASLKDAAAVNTIRKRIFQELKQFNLPIGMWSGGRTKHNRIKQGYSKDHYIDASCVGESGLAVLIPDTLKPLIVTAIGRGSRQMCRVDRYGFPRTKPKSVKTVHGFQTGDIVRAAVPKGKKAGQYFGKLAVRASGSFDIKTATGKIQGINHKYFKLIQKVDGYAYQLSD